MSDGATSRRVARSNPCGWGCASATPAARVRQGQRDEALRRLSGAIEIGFINHRFFAEHVPFLATLRGDPCFEALMERARAKEREIEAEA